MIRAHLLGHVNGLELRCTEHTPSYSSFKLQPSYHLITTIITTKIFKNSCWLLRSNQWTGRFWEQWAQSCDSIWKNISVVQLYPPQNLVKNAIFLGWAFVTNLIFRRQELQSWCVFFFSFSLRLLILNVFLTEWFFWLTSVICILKINGKTTQFQSLPWKPLLLLTVHLTVSLNFTRRQCWHLSCAVQGCVWSKRKCQVKAPF